MSRSKKVKTFREIQKEEFNKRKVQSDFSRNNKASKRTERKKILVVCEDQKIFPEYLNKIINKYGLRATISVDGKCGSSPKSVYEHAIKKIEDNQKASENDSSEKLDFVYCVMDVDQHGEALANILNTIKQKKVHLNVPIIPIVSNPCSEVWLLRHLTGSTSFVKDCDAVIKKIQDSDPNLKKFKKGDEVTNFEYFFTKIDTAIANSKTVKQDLEGCESKNPSSDIYILIEKILSESKCG